MGFVAHAAAGGEDFVDGGAFGFSGDGDCGADGGDDDAVAVFEAEVYRALAVHEEGVEVDDCGAAVADEFDLAQGSCFVDAAGFHEGVEDGVEDGEVFAARAFDVADDEGADLPDGSEGDVGFGVVEVLRGGLDGDADLADGASGGGDGGHVGDDEQAV